MKKHLLPLLSVLALAGCGEPEIPENFGVFARLTNGDLVKLERAGNVKKTGMVFFGNRSSIDMMEAARAQKFNYILEKPTVTLDMDEVEGFIVFGEGKVDDNVKIKYFADALSFNGKFFDNKGEGAVNESTYLDQGTNCGLTDGALNKKINENMYLFTLPKAEKTDYKFCSLTTFKEAGKGTRKSPHVAVDFYGWYYDGVYWTFNVDEEDSEGKEKEEKRQEIIAERIKKTEAEKKEKLRLAKAELKSYETLPVVENLDNFSKFENILTAIAKKNDGYGFGVDGQRVKLGAFLFSLKKEGINEFEFEELKEEMEKLVTSVKSNYSQKEAKITHVKVTNLNIPIKLNTRGWFTISTEDRKKHLDPLVGLYSQKTKDGLNILSPKAASNMKYPDDKFIFGTELLTPKGSRDGTGYIDLKFDEEKDVISSLGKRNGGQEIIEEITLKYHYNRKEHRRIGTNSRFFISSFKLKGLEDRIVNTDSKKEKYGPYKYKFISNLN
jgi:hypothetical protein